MFAVSVYYFVLDNLAVTNEVLVEDSEVWNQASDIAMKSLLARMSQTYVQDRDRAGQAYLHA